MRRTGSRFNTSDKLAYEFTTRVLSMPLYKRLCGILRRFSLFINQVAGTHRFIRPILGNATFMRSVAHWIDMVLAD